MILAKIEQHSWDSPDRTLSSAIRKNRLIIFTGDEKQNGPVKTRVTCQFMVKRPFSLDEMQPDRCMPMPSVHYGRNSIFGPKSMMRFCDDLIQILEMFTKQVHMCKFWFLQIRYCLRWCSLMQFNLLSKKSWDGFHFRYTFIKCEHDIIILLF